MKLRTEISIPKSKFNIEHKNEILLLGSCFAENIGQKLKEHQFTSSVNPCGIAYNPISLFKLMDDALKLKKTEKEDLIFFNGMWHSPDHHSEFSNVDKEACLTEIAQVNSKLLNDIKGSKIIFVSVGTAWVYEEKSSGRLFNNCHKIPNRQFNKRILSTSEIGESFEKLIHRIEEINPDVQIIFTVSPIRHIKDGMIENNRSKSLLNFVVHQQVEKYQNAHYFPSYEVLIDDLRDYRFYENDMVHPSGQAIDYIWDLFKNTYFSADTHELCIEIDKINKSMAHRPFNVNSEDYKDFKAKLEKKIRELEKRFDFIKFS